MNFTPFNLCHAVALTSFCFAECKRGQGTAFPFVFSSIYLCIWTNACYWYKLANIHTHLHLSHVSVSNNPATFEERAWVQTVRNQHVWIAAVFCEAACSLEASAEEGEEHRSCGCEGQLAWHSARSALSCSHAIA